MNTQGFRGRYSSQTEKKVAKSKRLCFEQWLCRVAVKRTRVSPATGPGLSCFSSIHGLFAIQLGHLSTLSTWPGPEAGLRGASKPGPACPSPSLTHGPPEDWTVNEPTFTQAAPGPTGRCEDSLGTRTLKSRGTCLYSP